MTVLIRTANGGFAHPDDPGEPGYGDARKRWSVTPRECRVLAALAADRNVLEIGTGLGVSTRALASGARSVVSIDVCPWVASEIAPTLPGNVSFYGDRACVPELARWSLAFIDGTHEPDEVAADILFAAARLDRPGLLVLHDGRMAPVQAGIRESGIDTTAAYTITTETGLVLIALGGGD